MTRILSFCSHCFIVPNVYIYLRHLRYLRMKNVFVYNRVFGLPLKSV